MEGYLRLRRENSVGKSNSPSIAQIHHARFQTADADNAPIARPQPKMSVGDTNQALYKLFAAYIHTMPLEEIIESAERARLDAKLRYVVIYGAACSYCLARALRLDGSYLRTFALELKEQLAQTLAAFVASILTEPHRRTDWESAAEPPFRQIIDVLGQVMCTHDAEKLAISVLEICGDG
jgi:hypothetical protein